MSELDIKVFIDKKTGKELGWYTIEGEFEGEEESTIELLSHLYEVEEVEVERRTIMYTVRYERKNSSGLGDDVKIERFKTLEEATEFWESLKTETILSTTKATVLSDGKMIKSFTRPTADDGFGRKHFIGIMNITEDGKRRQEGSLNWYANPQTKATRKFQDKTYKRYTVLLRMEEDKELIDLIEQNRGIIKISDLLREGAKKVFSERR